MTDEIRANTNVPAEKACLGGMLLSREVVDDVMREVAAGDFWQPRHEAIFRAIGALVLRGLPTDVLAVQKELEETSQIDRAGGPAYLHELVAHVVTPANAGYHAALVKDSAVRRRLTQAGEEIVAMGLGVEEDLDALEDRARAALDRVSSIRKRGLRTIGETLLDVAERLEGKPNLLPTPWEALDRIIGGFAPGSLIVVAARPGEGKTIALLQIALKLAHSGMVAFSSLEMTEEELQLRMVAQYGDIRITTLRDRSLTEQDWHRFNDARLLVGGAPVFIDDTARATIGELRAHLSAVKRRGNVAGFCVDYLQLVKATGADRRLEVEAVSSALKQMAKEHRVPVIAAAQLKRPQMSRGGQRPLPTLGDLREAGGIEQDADVVILLHRDPKKPRELKVIVAKNRHGETAAVDLVWEAEYSRLRDRKWSPTSVLDGMDGED